MSNNQLNAAYLEGDELWKAVPGYEELYAVSDVGRVKKLSDKLGNQYISSHYDKRGHVSVRLYGGNVYTTFYLKNLVLGVFTDSRDWPIVFKNGNRGDCSLKNLMYAPSLIIEKTPICEFDNEIWKTSLSSERLMISNYGRVYSKESYVRSKSGWKLKPGRLLKIQRDADGYATIRFQDINYKIHRMVMEAFEGVSSLLVNHSNGNKSDNKLANLQYVSSSENALHKYKYGLAKEKFSNAKKIEICELIGQGFSKNAVAKKFETTPVTIRRIVSLYPELSKVKSILPRRRNVQKRESFTRQKNDDLIDYANECWQDVVGFENLYSVSSLGRIRKIGESEKYLIARLPKTGQQLIVQLNDGNRRIEKKVAAIVLAAFKGDLDHSILYKDGNKENCALSNLEYAEPIKHGCYSLLIQDLDGEIWKDIADFEGKYLVSNFGRVKSVARVVIECSGKKQTRAEKILSPAKDGVGYLRLRLHDAHKKKGN